MKLVKFALTPPIVAISIALLAAITSFGKTLTVGVGMDYADIASALANAGDDDEIVIAESSNPYLITSTIEVSAGVTIRSDENDPATVTIDAQNKCRAFILNHAKAKLQGLTITRGKLQAQRIRGANVFVNANGGNVVNCVICNGDATQWGTTAAGVSMEGPGLVSRCVISNCVAHAADRDKGGGSAMFVNDANATVENCLIAGNSCTGDSSDSTGAIRMKKGSILNCTIVKNSAKVNAGVYASGGTVKNCIIDLNTVQGGTPESMVYSGAQYFSKCLSSTVKINDDCFMGNPGFKDAGSGNFHLSFGSEARECGDATLWAAADKDLDGVSRLNENGTVDLGCYAYVFAGVEVSIDADGDSGFTPYKVTFTSQVAGSQDAATRVWDFGDGSEPVETDGDVVTHDFKLADDEYAANYVVSMKAVIGGIEYPASKTLSVAVYRKDLYLNEGEHLEDLIGKAANGSTIWVAKGTYPSRDGAEILIERDVTIAGQTGDPDDVIFTNKSGKNHRLFHLNSAGAKLANLTLTGGILGDQRVRGGDVMIDSLGGSIENCRIINGKASAWGDTAGGLSMEGPGLVSRCVISNCTASAEARDGGGGSALFVNNVDARVENCLIVHNTCNNDSSDSTGAVRIKAGSLVNCTIAKNTSKLYSGVYASGGSVVNCLISDNTSTGSSDPVATVFYGESRFSACAAPLTINDACFKGAAGFKNAEADDYHLTAGSTAALGNGALDTWTDDSVDLDGEKRMRDGKVDIGCYTYVKANVMEVSFDSDVKSGLLPLDVTFTATVSGETGDVTYEWDFGDGVYVSSGDDNFKQHRFAEAGKYVVKARATDSTGTYPAAATIEITAYPTKVFVVRENPNAAWPYATMETAATNVQDAVSVGTDGTEVSIAAGVYPLLETVEVNAAEWIHGATDDPEDTVLDAQGKFRVLRLNNSGAKLEGVALQGGQLGSSSSGSGLLVDSAGGQASNCIVRACKQGHWQSGSAVSLASESAIVTHCVISNNTARGCTTAASAVTVSAGIFAESLVVDNRSTVADYQVGDDNGGAVAVPGGLMRNCTVVGNVADEFAGVKVSSGGGRVVNTLIAGNADVAGTVRDTKRSYGVSESTFVNCLGEVEKINDTCVTGDPLFTDAAAGNYRIRVPSPARNAGTGAYGISVTDLDGNRRVYGRAVDIGCYECQSTYGLGIIVR